MRSRSVVLVTVAGPAGSEDVALAADVAVFQLMPALAALVGGEQLRAAGGTASASAAARLHLTLADRTLPPTRTLLASGVVDGQTLRLSTEGTGAAR